MINKRNTVIAITILAFVVIGIFSMGIGGDSSEEIVQPIDDITTKSVKITSSEEAKETVPTKKAVPPKAHISPLAATEDKNNFWRGLKNSAIRSLPITLGDILFDEVVLPTGTIISLELFDGNQLEVNVTNSIKNVNGTISTTAHVSGTKWGRVFIAQTDGQVRAKITLPEANKMYGIHFNQTDNQHYLLEFDPITEETDDAGLHPVAPIHSDGPKALYELAEDELLINQDPPIALGDESVLATVVDIFVIYTNNALSEVGSTAEMNNLIAIGMAMANDAHTTTDTGIVLNLVHSESVIYNESGNSFADLQRVTYTGDSYMDGIHTTRDDYGADFVSLIIGNSGGGVAWLLTSSLGSSSYAFSVVGVSSFDSYTPVHEIGHNMGLAHAYDQDYQWGPTGGSIGTDAAGWHWHPTPNATGFCSVMTYTSGSYFDGIKPKPTDDDPPAHAATDGLGHVRVGIFSDPAIDHGDPQLPAGNNTNGNNARVLRTYKAVYAGYKSRPIAANSILVEYPNETLTLTNQKPYGIKWNSHTISGNVKIDLYQNGTFQQVIAADTYNDRNYDWTIPANLNGNNFTIRVSSVSNTSFYDESDNTFSINGTFYSENLDNEPTGFDTTGAWKYGAWSEATSNNAGPESPNTGTNIYDTNLTGVTSANSLLTTTEIDCSNYTNVHLQFSGWFAVYTGYRARVQVSNDATSWHDLYTKNGDFYFTSWQDFDIDISTYADGELTVYVRWFHENVSGGGNYAGMSVDDIALTGQSVTSTPQLTISDATVMEGNSGTVTAQFTVELDTSSTDTITVDFSTTQDSATSGSDYSATSSTLTFDPNDTSKTISVSVNGDLIDEENETFQVNLSNPINATIADATAVGTITDDDAPPTISISDETVTEGNSGFVTAQFTVSLSAASGKTVTVNYATGGGTANAGDDYTAIGNTTLTFTPGDTQKFVNVSVAGDSFDENNETFQVNLSNPSNTTIADATAVGTITDNDSPPTISISDDTIIEGNSGSVSAQFTISLSAASGKTVTVNYATGGGTANAGDDYTAIGNTTLTFTPGDTQKSVNVSVAGDSLDEYNETFQVNLSNPSNATIADATAVGTITDDDSPPTISISDDTVTEGNSGLVTAQFSVSLSATSGKTVTVNYTTGGGTANAGNDYTAIGNTTLTFTPGDTEKDVNVLVTGDTLEEGNETFLVVLSNPVNASLFITSGVGTIMNDDEEIIARDDSYSISKDTELIVQTTGILANDTGTGGSLTAENFSTPSHGSLSGKDDGSFTYSPAAGFTGTDSFTYQVFNGITYSESATVTISIKAVATISGLPESCDFGTMEIGEYSTQFITITNTGIDNITISDMSILGDASFSIENDGVSFILGSGAEMEIEVTFMPDTIGSKVGELNITHGGGGSNPIQVNLTGAGKQTFNWLLLTPILIKAMQEREKTD